MGSKRRDRYIKWRGDIAYYYRRTPSDILSVDPRRFVEHSLKTSDRSIAEARRDAADNALAQEPVAEALLGTVEKPELLLTEALEVFWGIAADRIVGKSDDQVRVWHNPRKRAVGNFIMVVEDKALGELTRSDVLVFRSWWLERVQTRTACAETANKDFTHLSDIFQTVTDAYQLDMTNPFRGLRLKNNVQSKRTSLTKEEILACLLGKGCLDGALDQAIKAHPVWQKISKLLRISTRRGASGYTYLDCRSSRTWKIEPTAHCKSCRCGAY